MELNDLLMEISKICLIEQERMKHKQRKGDCFNVFNTLGLRSNEVRLHSAFLAELLNPDGNHGLKDAMLKEFLAAELPRLRRIRICQHRKISSLGNDIPFRTNRQYPSLFPPRA